MTISEEIQIAASKSAVWAIITDIENAQQTKSGIESIEVINKPENGFVGFKWREGRKMFGKLDYVTMWISEAVENKYYKAAAHCHGSKYLSTFTIEEHNNQSLLRMTFEATAISTGAKIMNGLMSRLIKKSMKKVLQQDLQDIKTTVEAQG